MLIQRGDIWHAVIYSAGRKVWRSLRTSDKRQANIAYGKLLSRMHPDGNMSWRDFKERYLEYSRTNKKAATVKFDEGVFERFEKICPVGRASDLSGSLLERFKGARVRAGKAPATVNRELGMLRSAVNMAREWGIGVDRIRVKPLPLPRRNPRAFTPDEMTRLRAAVHDELDEKMLEMGYFTGMRREELVWTRWQDVDFKGKVVRVSIKDGWSPKTYEERDIPLHPVLAGKLRGWYKRAGKWVFEGPGSQWYKEAGQKVIGKKKGCRARPELLTHRFTELSQRAKVTGTFHALRRTCGTRMIEAGVPLPTVARILGHADTRTTARYYASVTDISTRAGIEAIR